MWSVHMHNIMYSLSMYLPVVPTGAPVSVRAVTTGSTTIHLQWSPPPTNTINGVPLDYVISYGPANNREPRTRISTGDTRTRYEFTNLEPYTAYSFQVAVRNSIGMGPYSGTVSTVTATDGKHSNLCSLCPQLYGGTYSDSVYITKHFVSVQYLPVWPCPDVMVVCIPICM